MDILNALVLFSNFVVVPALAYGAQLALGALGVTLIYGILRFSNFAHGATMAFGTMCCVLITWWFQSLGISFGFLPTALLALPFAIVLCVVFVLLTDSAVYVERATLPEQVVLPLGQAPEKAPYFSMILLTKGADPWL